MKFVKALISDVVALLGAGLVVYGVYEMYPPVAYIVAGGFLVWYVLPIKKG